MRATRSRAKVDEKVLSVYPVERKRRKQRKESENIVKDNTHRSSSVEGKPADKESPLRRHESWPTLGEPEQDPNSDPVIEEVTTALENLNIIIQGIG